MQISLNTKYDSLFLGKCVLSCKYISNFNVKRVFHFSEGEGYTHSWALIAVGFALERKARIFIAEKIFSYRCFFTCLFVYRIIFLRLLKFYKKQTSLKLPSFPYSSIKEYQKT